MASATWCKRFEAQSASLTNATQHLADANRQIHEAIEERRPEIDSLSRR